MNVYIFNKRYAVGIFFLFISLQAEKSSKIQILFALNKFPKLTETFILGQMAGLLNTGDYGLHLWARQKDETDLVHEEVKRYDLLKQVTYLDYTDKKNIKQVISEINNFDIVYCQYDRFSHVFAELKRKGIFKGKLVVCIRGGSLLERIQKRPKDYQQLFEAADALLPVCFYYKNILIDAGCLSSKVIVHHSGIDCDKFSPRKKVPDKNTIRLITVARLIPGKGLSYAIQAIDKLVRIYPHLRYQIVGDGYQRHFLQSLINTLGIEKNVELLGWLPQDDIIQLLHDSHIFLLPSVENEGIANVLMEALACGLPVIAPNLHGIPELVKHGVSGYLTEVKNEDDLAQKIQYLITHEYEWDAVAMEGRVFVEKEHNIVRENRRLDKIFKALLKGLEKDISQFESKPFDELTVNFLS